MEHELLPNIIAKIPKIYFQIPIQALSNETKEKLKFLDCNFILPDNDVKLRDYRGLAILLGYSTLELNYLIDQKRYTSPTYLILERMKSEKKCISDILYYLKYMKRNDIIASIEDLCQNDVIMYLNRNSNETHQIVDYKAVKKLTSVDEIDEANKTLGRLFTTDIIETTNKKIDVYDIFISFDSESVTDIKVMWYLSELLERNGMTVAKGSYSFFQGCCLIEAFANAIYNRSRKVILLISQSFINSETCLMQLNFARDADKASWRNKVIPVYIENVKKPESIANINGFIYYNEFIRENFMNNFINSLKNF